MKFLTLRSWWVASAVLFTPAIGSAQSPGIVLKAGDVLSTGERVQDIRDALIGDDGSVLALVETDLADLTQDLVLLRDGVIVLREGSPLSAPAGTTLDDWDGLSMNALGDLGMVVRLSSPVAFLEKGAYWNGVKVAVKDQVIESPHLGTGTEWETVHVVKLNSSRTMFLVGDVSNPALPRVRERALVRYQLDSAGNILDTTVLATEGMTLAGIVLTGASCLIANAGVLAVNERGDTLTMIGQDGLQALVMNMQTIVARTGAPSPVAGKNWREGGFSLSRVTLNDLGGHAFTGAIGPPGAGDGYLVVKDGQKFVEATDVLPVVGTVGAGSSAPLYLANSGDLYWHVRGSAGDAFMRNLQVIVQAQSTVVGGQLVTGVAGVEAGFHASRDGRF